jgi:hypothetical protein
MLCALLVASLAIPQAAAPQAVTRFVTVAVYTKRSEPVADLKAEEVSVTEDGKKRTVLGLLPDTRPLEVAVVIDSSVVMASSYRSDLVSAVTALWRSLPPDARVAVWTSGPPSKVVAFGTDLATAEPRLQAVAPAGKNYALDALLDASRGMSSPGDVRRVLVYVGGGDIEASQVRSAEMVRAIGQAGATPMVVLILGGASASASVGGPTSGSSFATDIQGYFEQVAAGYRGSCTVVLSTQAALKALQDVAADLASQYRVRYESTAGDPPPPKVEVHRKGTKVRVGRTQVEVLKRD